MANELRHYVGKLVKKVFYDGEVPERMWAEVTAVKGDKLICRLDSYPVFSSHKLNEEIEMTEDEIVAVFED